MSIEVIVDNVVGEDVDNSLIYKKIAEDIWEAMNAKGFDSLAPWYTDKETGDQVKFRIEQILPESYFIDNEYIPEIVREVAGDMGFDVSVSYDHTELVDYVKRVAESKGIPPSFIKGRKIEKTGTVTEFFLHSRYAPEAVFRAAKELECGMMACPGWGGHEGEHVYANGIPLKVSEDELEGYHGLSHGMCETCSPIMYSKVNEIKKVSGKEYHSEDIDGRKVDLNSVPLNETIQRGIKFEIPSE